MNLVQSIFFNGCNVGGGKQSLQLGGGYLHGH
jgi:hypothetical protein